MTSHHDQIAKLAKTLEEWDYKIDRLENRVKDLPDELRAIAEAKYQKVLDFRNELQEKEENFIEVSESAVQEIEKSVASIADTFKLLFKDVEVAVEVEGT
jgi:archaellum component FlaC